MQGFINRTPRGREVTEAAYLHMGKYNPGKSGSLF
jgi:holliday junction DNA helicase RuvB